MQFNNQTQQIDRTVGYSVREIMTPAEVLLCWTGEEDKRDELISVATDNDFTYIPVKTNNVIIGIIKLSDLRQDRPEDKITADWLIGVDTPILQLFDLFAKQDHQERRNFLVLQSSQIVGLVSPADLNQIPARASVYLLVAHFEQSLAKLIRHVLKDGESSYINDIPQGHRDQAKSNQRKNEQAGIQLDLLNYVNLSDLREIVVAHEELRQIFGFDDAKTTKQALTFGTVRNPVSHATSVFIHSRKQITEINDSCQRLIKYGEIMRPYLPKSS